ncbi:MAG: ABC-F family ATP-binding cassette domain-containing protein [Saprospiraceae bacterium]|nr:ABC-F family ATP-binding cassette domain-containing protein [Saprospiraceae bacterium]
MTYLELENVSKSYGEKILFDQVSLHINKGQKVGLVARNGSGKSTLLRVAAGVDLPEGTHARVGLHPEARLGFLTQDAVFEDHKRVIDVILDTGDPVLKLVARYQELMERDPHHPDMEHVLHDMEEKGGWARESRIQEVLGKLNLHDLEKTVGQMSGGEKKRLDLARVILEDPDFLILDEPTNHLDVEMIEWLEQFLSQPGLTIFIVTHDRYFLENVCDTIVELDRGAVYKYKGNYADYLEKKTTREETGQVEQGKLRKLMLRELDWVRRSPSGRGTKAKSRVDRFHQIKEAATAKGPDKDLQIDLKGSRLGSKILEAHYLTKRFDDKLLVDHFSYKFKKGERVGIVGPNGIGKTTFLQMLTQELRPDSGKIVIGGTVVFGYYTQSGLQLAEDKRVIDVIRDIAEFVPLDKGQKLTAPQLLERFMFSRPQQQVYVSQLSGGEKRRLHLLSILMHNPNFLILDEPTNDLDVITLNVLEDYLMDFPGVVLIVTHDRYFMDKIVDHLFIFEGEGQIRDYNGTYTEYRTWLREKQREDRAAREPEPQKVAAPRKGEQSGITYQQKKQMDKLEKEVAKLEERKAQIHSRFAEETLSGDEIMTLSKELDGIQQQIQEKELAWMMIAEEGKE